MKPSVPAVVLVIGAAALWLEAGRSEHTLNRLYEQQRWFQFRDTLAEAKKQPGPFYRGALAYAFLDWTQAEAEFQPLMESPQISGKVTLSQAIRAGEWLFQIDYFRGQYRRAWEQLEKVTRMSSESLTPERNSAIEHFREECRILSQYPDQVVTERAYSRLLYSEVGNALYLPLTVNGRQASYSIDTGAAPSYLSESEAQRLGLKVHPVEVDVNSAKTSGVAVADEVVIGNFHLRNVWFEIFHDEDLHGDQGVIGFPVLMAFETIRWNSAGVLEIGFPPAPANLKDANLFYDDHFLVTDAGFQNRRLRLLLDTGGYETHLQPRFAREFASVAKGPKEKFSFDEIGATVEREAISLPQLKLQVGGFDATLLAGHHVLLEEWDDSDASRHGELGMDVLSQAAAVTIDLRAMRLTLDGGGWREAVDKACPLPADFRCRPGWNCTVKSEEKLKCYIDRVRIGAEGDDADEDVSVCPLPGNFVCPSGSHCTAFFEPGGKCRVEKVKK